MAGIKEEKKIYLVGAKQHAGMTNCQATDFRKLAFHFNASLAAIPQILLQTVATLLQPLLLSPLLRPLQHSYQ